MHFCETKNVAKNSRAEKKATRINKMLNQWTADSVMLRCMETGRGHNCALGYISYCTATETKS